jgi:putative protein kinase ArgK-like GTPase of G3E family
MLRTAREDVGGHHNQTVVEDTTDDLAPWLSRRPGTLIDPRAYLVSGAQGTGIMALVDDLEALGAACSSRWQADRQASVDQDMRDAVLEEASRRLRDTIERDPARNRLASALRSGDVSVIDAATRLLTESAAQSR